LVLGINPKRGHKRYYRTLEDIATELIIKQYDRKVEVGMVELLRGLGRRGRGSGSKLRVY